MKHIIEVIAKNPNFMPHPAFLKAARTPPDDWVETRYEKRGKRKGHSCSYLSYILK
ncbi:MAG: hypothetical protein IBJ00_05450 [Alphaproteobacteria bacterium]|nr:hypothetical protein [Alphaproteobacteria bacterium]